MIPQGESFKFLGLTNDSKLEWKQHFTLLFNKLPINRRLSSLNKNILSAHTKRLIYYAYIYSHLSYCILIWDGAISSQNFLKLTRLQNSCIGLINNSNLRAHVNQIYTSLKLLSLDPIIVLELQKFCYKLYHKYLPTPIIKGIEKIHNTCVGDMHCYM